MTRIEALKLKVKQYPYEKSAKKLSEADFDRVVEFIDDNDHLGHLEFEYAVNRMFLDKPKPKHFAIMQELLSVVNTAAKGVPRVL